MAKIWAKGFYTSKAWEQCREGFILSVYGLCNRCNSPGYIVHHKILLTPTNIVDPEISLNWEHLEYLCSVCHNKEHMTKDKDTVRQGLTFNSNGDLIVDMNV